MSNNPKGENPGPTTRPPSLDLAAHAAIGVPLTGAKLPALPEPSLQSEGSHDQLSVLHDHLARAIETRDLVTLHRLLAEGCDPACRNGQLVVFASERQFKEGVTALLERGERMALEGARESQELLRQQLSSCLRAYIRAGGGDPTFVDLLKRHGLVVQEAIEHGGLGAVLPIALDQMRHRILRDMGSPTLTEGVLTEISDGDGDLRLLADLIKRGARISPHALSDCIFQFGLESVVPSEQQLLDFLGEIPNHDELFDRQSVLRELVALGYIRAIDQLLNQEDSQSNDLLSEAIKWRQPEVVDFLTSKRNLPVTEHHIRDAIPQDDVSVIRILLKRSGLTLNGDHLLVACASQCDEMTRFIVEEGHVKPGVEHLIAAASTPITTTVTYFIDRGLRVDLRQLFQIASVGCDNGDETRPESALKMIVERALDTSIDPQTREHLRDAVGRGDHELFDLLMRRFYNLAPGEWLTNIEAQSTEVMQLADQWLYIALQKTNIPAWRWMISLLEQVSSPSKSLTDLLSTRRRNGGFFTGYEGLDAALVKLDETVALMEGRYRRISGATIEGAFTALYGDSEAQRLLASLSPRLRSTLGNTPGGRQLFAELVEVIRKVSKVLHRVDRDATSFPEIRAELFFKELLPSTLIDMSSRCANLNFSVSQYINQLVRNSSRVNEEFPEVVERIARDVVLTPLVAHALYRDKLSDLGTRDVDNLFLHAKFRALDQLSRGRSLGDLIKITNFLSRPQTLAPITECRPLLGRKRWEPIFKELVDVGDGYTVEALANVDQLLQEGIALNHCVGQDPKYASLCTEGRIQILSFRRHGEHKATLTISRGYEDFETDTSAFPSNHETSKKNESWATYRWKPVRETFKKRSDVPVRDESAEDRELNRALLQFVQMAKEERIHFNPAFTPLTNQLLRGARTNDHLSYLSPFELLVGVPMAEPELVWRFKRHYDELVDEKYKTQKIAGKGRGGNADPGAEKPLIDFDQFSEAGWLKGFFEGKGFEVPAEAPMSERCLNPLIMRSVSQQRHRTQSAAQFGTVCGETAVTASVGVEESTVEVILSAGSFNKTSDQLRVYAHQLGGRLATRLESFAFLFTLLEREEHAVINEAEAEALRIYRNFEVIDEVGEVHVGRGGIRSSYKFVDKADPEFCGLVVRVPCETREGRVSSADASE